MSDGSQVSHKLLQRLAEKRAAEEAAKQQEQQDLSQWAEFVPDIEIDSPGLSRAEIALDEFMKLIPITEAYQRWGGQSAVSPGKKEVKVRCPNPQHTDKDPSFVMNTEKNVFNCFKCGGGDIYDIAAWHKGFPVPGYKDQAYFRDLKDSIAADYGMQIDRSLGGSETLYKAEVSPETPVQEKPSQSGTNVLYTPEGAGHAEENADLDPPRHHESIDWRHILPQNTFMRTYMEAVATDTCPEEYHFWLGLLGLGMAVGRNVTLKERSPVKPNLYVCLTGPSGTGKSRAKSNMLKLLRDNIPYKKDDYIATGARILADASSGEIVVRMLQHDMLDANGKPTGQYSPVRILLETEELADIITKSGRQGNSLKGVMSRLYDGHETIESNSMANALTAIMPFGSAITTTQNKSIRDLFSKKDDNSGFLNRWIFATGVPKNQLHIDRTTLDLTRAGGLIRLIHNDAENSYSIDWEQLADEMWKDAFDKEIVPRKNSVDTSILERLDLTMKKIFLLLAINKRDKLITVETVKEGMLIFPYLLESYGIVEQQIAATEIGDDQDFVLRTIERLNKQGKSVTANAVYKAAKHRIPDVGTVKKILQNFVEMHMIQDFKKPAGPSGGRPTTVYMIS
jgi:hypothetical protein